MNAAREENGEGNIKGNWATSKGSKARGSSLPHRGKTQQIDV